MVADKEAIEVFLQLTNAIVFTLQKIDKAYYDTTPELLPIVDDYYKKLPPK
ncbi:hypothetical protein [Lysinibacillus piscis]|uniref:Uncharacterized protein n=1 Tax=Lysinibacillus piscis TaxID=2518931 RepID=A0ABQ5NIX6_9BACI|nr:hypothetical protein [Lysinibacillus sp. KH24]GLC88318.1 hypothetical protein LYSBPC_14450 [Lysinibacillus sp. KH24]